MQPAPALALASVEELAGIRTRATSNTLTTDRVLVRADTDTLVVASQLDCNTLEKVEAVDRKAARVLADKIREENDPDALKKLQIDQRRLMVAIARNYDSYQIQCLLQ